MAIDSQGTSNGTERWDQLYDALSAQPRRMIIFSLLKHAEERRLPLPDAAQAPGTPMDAERLCLQLRHRHLPMLEDAGYIRWERDPFSVERGPYFEEPALVVSKMTEESTTYPRRLREECVVIGSVTESPSD